MKLLKRLFQGLLGAAALVLTTMVVTGRLIWRALHGWWKRSSKWLRRSIRTLLIFIATAFVALIAYAWYDSKYGRQYWGDEILSEDVELHCFQNSKFRVYNSTTDTYTTTKINWASQAGENDSLAVYAIDNRRGYINVKNGEILIDAKHNDYEKAWVFSEGVAAVMKDGKVGFINAKNEVVIPFIFNYSNECKMYDFGYAFHDGHCAMTGSNGKLGLIDKSGNWIIEPAYDEIWAPRSNGYRMTINNGKYGVITNYGAVVYPAEYRYITIMPHSFILTKAGREWQVDFEGNMVQPFMFDSTYYLNYPIGYNENGDIRYGFSEYIRYGIMDRYGIMNRITGEPITLALYSDINMISEELFEVREYDSYEWYLLDTNGNVVSTK